ncbi:MAG: hypothetical protein OXQ31_09565 [Spirochaetaceae bacterium]|nr:hypothetical protein [Spirochaetaceae bacterium]
MSSPPSVVLHADATSVIEFARELGVITEKIERLPTREDLMRSRSRLVAWSVVTHALLAGIVLFSALGLIPKVV